MSYSRSVPGPFWPRSPHTMDGRNNRSLTLKARPKQTTLEYRTFSWVQQPAFRSKECEKSTKSGQTEISAEIKSKVLFQLGSIAFKLSQLRFDCIGSLFEHDGIVQVGECFSRGHILHERYSLEDVPRGPFTSETQFYSLIKALIQHAETFTTIASLFCRTCSSPGAIWFQWAL